MLKWIIILIALYSGIPVFPPDLLFKTPSERKKAPPEIQDEMVQDPVCKTYVPKRLALKGTGPKGKRIIFAAPNAGKTI